MKKQPAAADKSTDGMVDYGRHSVAQQQLVDVMAGRIRQLTERLGLVEPELKIMDYGCGPGPSAINAVKPAIQAYRARYPDAPIAVCHADQPGNDWNALFKLAAGPSGYLAGATNLRSGAAVGSFYQQMAAAGSVALGTSFYASQWLSQAVRLNAPGAIWFADLTGSARDELAALASRDWARFLRCRAVELRPGGFFLLSTLGAVADASEVNGAAASGRGIYRAMQRVTQDMAREGAIDPQVLDHFVFGLWFLTAEEARRPLEDDPQLAEAFEIEHIGVAPAAQNPDDLFAHAIGDPAEYARLYTGHTRAFAHATLMAQVFTPSTANAAEAERLAENFYDRLQALYWQDLAKYACELWYVTVVLRRR